MSTIATASRQYATRPADERFPSLQAMIEAAQHDRELSAERLYTLKDLKVQPGGDKDLMLASSKGAARFSHWSFGQFCSMVGAPARFLRDDLSPEIASDVLNYRIGESPVGTQANVLVRGANGMPPTVRAATSESYGRVWDSELYSAIDRQIVQHGSSAGGDWTLPPTWSGETAGAYRGDRDSFLILTNGGSIVTDPTLINRPGTDGSMYRGLLVRNSEVGASSIVIESILYRYVCGNHMLWGAAIDRQFRRRHVGGVKALRDTLREIGTIAHRWANHSGQRDQAIIDSLIANEIATTREGVIDQLRAMGATQDQAERAYDSCVRTEPASPRSYWGIAQGLTRISQETGYQDDRYQLDKLAGLVIARGAKVAA